MQCSLKGVVLNGGHNKPLWLSHTKILSLCSLTSSHVNGHVSCYPWPSATKPITELPWPAYQYRQLLVSIFWLSTSRHSLATIASHYLNLSSATIVVIDFDYCSSAFLQLSLPTTASSRDRHALTTSGCYHYCLQPPFFGFLQLPFLTVTTGHDPIPTLTTSCRLFAILSSVLIATIIYCFMAIYTIKDSISFAILRSTPLELMIKFLFSSH